jgi:hypothetical protein
MGQYWKIFNLTKGKVLFVYDGSKYDEKSISIDVLLHLLQDEWKNDKIVMIGDYDQTPQSAEFTREFLETYGLSVIDNKDHFMNNLYLLESEGFLPKQAYPSNLAFESILGNFGLEQKTYHFLLNKRNPELTEEDYIFVDHTTKEYVLFNQRFFQGFYNTKTKKPLTMTLIQYNHLVQDIVLGLITNNSEYKDELKWHGRFAGHQLSFEKSKELDSYQNISSLFIKDDVDKNKIYRNFSNIIYTLNPQMDLDLSDEES